MPLTECHKMGKYGKYTKKYKTEWEKDSRMKGWLARNKEENILNGQHEAYCTVCKCAMRPHFNDLLSHRDTTKHKTNAAKFDRKSQLQLNDYGVFQINDKAKVTDLKLAVFIATHCSVSTVDHFGELLKELGKGSALENVKLHRTKYSKLISEVVAPTFLTELLQDIGDSPYSLIIDEVTDISVTKFMGICVRFFCKRREKMVVGTEGGEGDKPPEEQPSLFGDPRTIV